MINIKSTSLAVALFIFFSETWGKVYDVSSPNEMNRIKVEVTTNGIYYSVFHNNQEIISASSISMKIDDGEILGKNPKVKEVERENINNRIYPIVSQKRRVILDYFNELVLKFVGNYSLEFRAYDDGVAYRFITDLDKKVLKVNNEDVTFNFLKDCLVYFPEEESFITHSERLYKRLNLSDIKDKNMASLPVLVEIEEGPKVIISEANLEDYPGLYLKGTDGQNFSFIGIFPAYPIKEEQKDDRTMIVSERADYIALTDGKRCFPWRIIGIAEEDGDLIESELVCKLAKPLQLEDVSWIKPGKVAWDWWNANNVYGVDFKSGVNTETYKYYIDFAAANNIEYIIMDEGWSDTENLLKVNPNIDMKEILSYADEKNVGVILWCVWLTLDKQLEQALDRFEEWRIKGIKVDFMQRDDQKMVNFYHKIVKEAAKRHMLVDFHGAYKPTGLRRAYPNLVTREGVLGLEWNKWSADCNPEHDLTIPFIRMFAGPMDYTPGAMNNAQEVNFRDIFERPMSQGTRVHQLAMYVVYESPLQMLADSPSNYMKEPEIVSFLSKVPTTWDETIVLEAKVSDYVIIARKSGDDWYIGAMTDWTSRKFQIDLSFLDGGKYNAEIYQDGINADRYASDYKRVIKVISKNDKIDIDLAPGGGWVARIHK